MTCDCCETNAATTRAYEVALCPPCLKAARRRQECRH